MRNNIDESKIITRYKNIYDYKGNKEVYNHIKKQFKNVNEDKYILKQGFNTNGECMNEDKYWKNQMKEWKDIL